MALNFLRSFRSGSGQALGGRYTILKQLGAGGFGQTFLAQDLHLPGQPQCVIKQLKPHDRGAQQLQVARRLFDTEAQALYNLGAHPQIPRLLAHFEENGEFYLAQELIEGHSLAEEFSAAPWTEAKTVAFLGDVLGTLTFVHDHRAIHRDLKPSNLIRRHSDRRIVMIDFGAVKQTTTQLIALDPGAGHTVAVGTQGYMPSEQVAGQPRFSSDIYAVGVMGIQALTGLQSNQLAHNPDTGEIDWHRSAPKTSPALKLVIDTMVRYDFRTRYPTAREALAALQALPTSLSQHLPPISGSSLASAAPPEEEGDRALPPSIPTPPIPGPPSPQTQQTVAVAGHHPQASTVDDSHKSTIATEQALPSLRPNRSTAGNKIIPVLVAIAAIFGGSFFAWRAFSPTPPIFSNATDSATGEAVNEGELPDLDQAQAAVTEFYRQVSAQSWAEAQALTAGPLAEEFNPSFFQQFRRVSVENLQVQGQSVDALTLVGENVYTYSDGSTQLEERTFTVQLVEGEPRIVNSTFVRVIKSRS